MTGDTKFATLLGRLNNVDELDKLVEKLTIIHSPEEVMELMQSVGVPAAVVQDSQDLDNDPQMKHRHFYWELDHPAFGTFYYSGTPVKLSETPYEVSRSPCLGEHNEYVYTKLLGMSDQEFISLLDDGVFK